MINHLQTTNTLTWGLGRPWRSEDVFSLAPLVWIENCVFLASPSVHGDWITKQFETAREEGKVASFDKKEPDKLHIDGQLIRK